MTAMQAIVLGLVQGLTEFLPVSSSGHLLLGSFLLNLPAPGLSLSILLHLGTAFATVVMLWREIVWLIAGLFAPKDVSLRSRALTVIGFLVLASIPGAVVGVFFGDFIDKAFGSGGVAAVGLIVTGFILKSAGRTAPGNEGDARGSAVFGTLNLKRAMVVGLSQGVAVIPGISRSGATITSGLLSGMGREDAARFSFLLALPAVFGGALLDFRKAIALGEPAFTGMGLVGAAVAFLAGIFALSAVFRVVRKGEISRFAYYCWAAGALSLVWVLIRR